MTKSSAPLGKLLLKITVLLLKLYLRVHPSNVEFRGFLLRVPAGCFPPILTASTELLADVLERELTSRRGAYVLDVGCGIGALTILAAKLGSYAVGTDINAKCAAAALENAKRNGADARVDIVVCDSATCLRGGFDIAVTNPPFLPLEGDPSYACGEKCGRAERILREAKRVADEVLYTWSSFSGQSVLGGVKLASRRGLFDEVYVYKS